MNKIKTDFCEVAVQTGASLDGISIELEAVKANVDALSIDEPKVDVIARTLDDDISCLYAQLLGVQKKLSDDAKRKREETEATPTSMLEETKVTTTEQAIEADDKIGNESSNIPQPPDAGLAKVAVHESNEQSPHRAEADPEQTGVQPQTEYTEAASRSLPCSTGDEQQPPQFKAPQHHSKDFDFEIGKAMKS